MKWSLDACNVQLANESDGAQIQSNSTILYNPLVDDLPYFLLLVLILQRFDDVVQILARKLGHLLTQRHDTHLGVALVGRGTSDVRASTKIYGARG